MSVITKDLGAATAYAYAVEKGYTGTEAEFAELMADYVNVGQRAEDAADSALESKSAAQTAAQTATNKASEAAQAAQTATTKATEAQADADAAALDASQAMSAASTATSKATEATTAAATAVSSKDAAVSANTAAQSAKTAAQTAQQGAETARDAVQSSAAQITTNAEDITQLKEELNNSIVTIDNSLAVVTTAYISMSDKELHSSYSWVAYKFDNSDGKLKFVDFRVHTDNAKYAVAFYTSTSTINSSTFISGYNNGTTGIQAGVVPVPNTAKAIIVSNRSASLVNPTIKVGYSIQELFESLELPVNGIGLETNIKHIYVKTADGTIAASDPWRSYYFKNIGYSYIKCTVFMGDSSTPVAFYSSDTPSNDTFLSCVTSGIIAYAVGTYEVPVPIGAKSFIVGNRYDSYSTPSIGFVIDGTAISKNFNDYYTNKAINEIRNFGNVSNVGIHRGYTGAGEVENTLGAYYDAWLFGAKSAEVDARKSLDGVYFCCHDTTITGIDADTQQSVTYTIAQTNASQLEKVIINSNSKYGVQMLPKISEVFEIAYKTGLEINLDMKDIRTDASQAGTISTALATLAHESGLAGRVIYATNGGGIDAVNAVLSVDPDARFIDTAGNVYNYGLANVPDYQNKVIAYIPAADFTPAGLAYVRSIKVKLCLSSINASNFNTFIIYHPDMIEFESNADFQTLVDGYIDNVL